MIMFPMLPERHWRVTWWTLSAKVHLPLCPVLLRLLLPHHQPSIPEDPQNIIWSNRAEDGIHTVSFDFIERMRKLIEQF
ncbi:hypothetical protein GCK72_019430 [Caenorhabditis remanei]|uniref:Uncharacterized protein n=1 Tax=Caenorhabditis remanei TaxID=31234 RepID=A0A6A5GDY2_CAERE|nr:hypothetical protein GCK72_019430 [Caenorhabditis remanei]KAF1752875.1 hypothetical protein GCK72_019430 [Caenorhabditis remanei]